MESSFRRVLAAIQQNLSGLEKFSLVLTIILALAIPAGSAIYVLGQQKNALDALNAKLNTVPTTEEFNLQLQLRDVRLQRLEYQLDETLRKLDEIRDEIRRTHQ